MKFIDTELDNVLVIENAPKCDERGFLMRTFCAREFASRGLNTNWTQHNHTLTKVRGSVRGMHWQADPKPEIKLVRCIVGSVLDVVVDIRPNSKTFGQWTSFELSAENHHAIYIPDGFAHGFQCLEETCELLYLMSEFYDPQLARGVRCDDPQIGIRWALPILNLSDRDQSLPSLSEI